MIVTFAGFMLFAVAIAFVGFKLVPMLHGNSQRLELILSDQSLGDRYRPMARLLREDDWKYLASQPGFTSSKIRSIRAQRRQVFRRYLSCLTGDFAGICFLVRAIMVQSEMPRPDLAKALFRCRMNFAKALFQIEVRLCLHAAGFTSVRIETAGLLGALESIGAQVRNLHLAQPVSLAA